MNERFRYIFGAVMITLCIASIAHAQQAPAGPVRLFRPGEFDPAVAAIVEANPRTPRELLQAAATLADLGRPDVAKDYLEKLAAANLDEQALARLAVQLEPNVLLRVAADEALQPEGRQIADAVLLARANLTGDQQRLAATVDRLADTSRAAQREALTMILAAGEDAVPAILAALADPQRATVHAAARQALMQLGPQAVAPLVAALETDNVALKVQIIDALAQLGSRKAVVFLAAPATADSSPAEVLQAARRALEEIQGIKNPTPADAIKLLSAEIERAWRLDRPMARDVQGNVSHWRWDAATRRLDKEQLTPARAASAEAARLARDLVSIAPNDQNARRALLIGDLEVAADRVGLDQPLPQGAGSAFERAARMGPAAVEDALDHAISTGHPAAAIGAIQVLGSIGDRSMLQSTDAEARPLVQALVQGDRRLRFAAAEAIMKLQPTAGFAGCSDLVKSLVFFASSAGERRALVAFPNQAVATQLAAMLNGMGYQADVATWGRQAFLAAIGSGDYELILLSGRIDHPPVYVVLEEWRHNPNTALVPVGLMGEPGDAEYLDSVKADDELTSVFERPYTDAGMKFHVERLVQQAGQAVVPAKLRSKQALTALHWLKQLNQASPRDFDIRPYEAAITRSLYSPEHSAAAAELLALIGTQTAQETLVGLANTSTWPLDMRKAAAAALGSSVRRYGIMLTTGDILRQYERYNQSAIEDAATQELLGLILDAIELPTAQKAEGGTPARRGGERKAEEPTGGV